MTRKLLITCANCAGPLASGVHAVAALRSSRANGVTTDYSASTVCPARPNRGHRCCGGLKSLDGACRRLASFQGRNLLAACHPPAPSSANGLCVAYVHTVHGPQAGVSARVHNLIVLVPLPQRRG